MAVYYTNNETETHKLAVEVGKKLNLGDVIAFKGGLGAGKTTFTRGLVEGMGIVSHVSSPTFALINEYTDGGGTLCHFDMYRIQSFEDLLSTGYFDLLDSGNVLAIEWSENIKDELPDNTITIELEVDSSSPNQRKITIEGGAF